MILSNECCDQSMHHLWAVSWCHNTEVLFRWLCNGLDQDYGQIIVYNLHPLFETDEFSEESWQLITAIHDEGDCLTLSEWRSYHSTHLCSISLVSFGTNRKITFKVLLLSCSAISCQCFNWLLLLHSIFLSLMFLHIQCHNLSVN